MQSATLDADAGQMPRVGAQLDQERTHAKMADFIRPTLAVAENEIPVPVLGTA